LRIAVPNKGSLAETAAQMLSEAGYAGRRDPKELHLVDAHNGVEFFFLRPRDIATYVGSGALDVGVTGRDLLLDSGSEASEIESLGFGDSTFRFAGPSGRFSELADLAGLRVATSYPGLVGKFLAGHDVDAALTVALRVLVIVLPSAVLIPWIDPDALGDHLAQRLRLPDRPVVATSAALQRVQSFGEIWRELGRARRIRALGVSWRHPRTVVAHLGALTMGLLVRTLRAAADLAVAMDARGFATATARSWWMPAPWRWRDTLLLALGALPLVVAVVAR